MIVENKTQIKSGILINADVSVKIPKNIISAKNIIFGFLLHIVAKSDRHLVSFIDDSVITCDETIETAKTFWQKLLQKN